MYKPLPIIPVVIDTATLRGVVCVASHLDANNYPVLPFPTPSFKLNLFASWCTILRLKRAIICLLSPLAMALLSLITCLSTSPWRLSTRPHNSLHPYAMRQAFDEPSIYWGSSGACNAVRVFLVGLVVQSRIFCSYTAPSTFLHHHNLPMSQYANF